MENNSNSSKGSFTITCLFFILVTSILFWPLFHPAPGEKLLIGGEDIRYFLYPMDTFALTCKKNFGYYPHWNPYLFTGYPHLASILQGNFDLVKICLQSVVPVHTYYFIIQYIYVLLSGIFMVFFIRYKTGNYRAGLLAGLVYAFSGGHTNSLAKGYPFFLIVYCFIPIVMYMTERLTWTKKTVHFAAALVLIFIYQLLSGHPQIIYYQWLLIYLYILLGMRLPFRLRIKKIALFSILILFSIGVAALQLVPTFLDTRDSLRGPANDYSFAQQYSYSKKHLIQTVYPGFWGNTSRGTFWLKSFENSSSFFGSFIFVFWFLNLLFIKRNRFLFWSSVFILFFAAALGRYTPAFRIFYSLVPGMSLFRGPDRLLIIPQVAIAVLTGYGIDFFESQGPEILKKKLVTFIIWGVVAAAVCGSIYVYVSGPENRLYTFLTHLDPAFTGVSAHHTMVSRGIILHNAVIAVSLVLTILYRCRSRTRVITWALILITAGEFLYYGKTVFKVMDSNTLRSMFSGVYTRLDATDQSRLLFAFPFLNQNSTLLHGVHNIKGFHDFLDTRFVRFQNAIGERDLTEYCLKRNRVIFNNFSSPLYPLTGVKYVASQKPLTDPNLKFQGKTGGLYLYTYRHYLPLFHAVSTVYVMQEGEDVFGRLQHISVGQECCISGISDTAVHYLPASATAVITVTHYSPDEIKLRVSAAGRVFIENLEAYNPGWKVYIDGSQKPLFRVNGHMRGFFIESGTHTAVLRFQPVSLTYGKAICLAAAVLCIGFLLFIMRRSSLE